MEVYDSRNNRVSIGAKIKKGGEGSIYRISSNNNLLAKIYNNPAGIEKQGKLLHMSENKNEKLLKSSAWPIDVLYDVSTKSVVGFLMNNITDSKLIHHLYTPKSRLIEFPEAGWDFLIHTAANLARLFETIHECGYIIGDVNHSNFLVSNRGIVKAIDCDSFQVSTNKLTYYCEVGEPTFQPPEFQDITTFDKVVRTRNHDNFGLAVMIFHLLFLGRHPFAGRYLGTGDMPVELAIKEFRFAYSLKADAVQMEPPPFTLRLQHISPAVIELFQRAFSREGAVDGGRPTAREWAVVLQGMLNEIKFCGRNLNHCYINTLKECPFCEIEKSIHSLLFKNAVRAKAGGHKFSNPEAIMSRIKNIPSPENVIKLPVSQNKKVMAYPELLRRKRIKIICRLLPFIFGLGSAAYCFLDKVKTDYSIFIVLSASAVGIMLSRADHKYAALRKTMEQNYFDHKKSLEELIGKWNREAGEDSFLRKRAELIRAYEGYKRLLNQRQLRIEELEKNKKELQLKRYLDKFRIDDEKIEGIGSGKKSLLRSYGVETALDITEKYLMAVPRLSRTHINRLLEWRTNVESRFVFDPSRGIDQTDLDEIDRSVSDLRAALEKQLCEGIIELKDISNRIIQRRKELLPEIEQCQRLYLQAEANFKAIT